MYHPGGEPRASAYNRFRGSTSAPAPAPSSPRSRAGQPWSRGTRQNHLPPLHNHPSWRAPAGAGRDWRDQTSMPLGPPGRNPSVGPALVPFHPPAGPLARRTSRQADGEVAPPDGLRVAAWNATFGLGRRVLFGVRAPGRAPKPLPPPAGPEGFGGKPSGAEQAKEGRRSPAPPILPRSSGRRCAHRPQLQRPACPLFKQIKPEGAKKKPREAR